MGKLSQLLGSVRNHPVNRGRKFSSVLRVLWWQVISRLFSEPKTIRFVNGTKLKVSRGMRGATGVIYNGLPEFEDMSFVLHLLRENDMFFDVGANVGVYSVMAAGGCKAKAYCFEPVPSAYQALCVNLELNNLKGKVEPVQCGVGEEKGSLKFATTFDTMNHVIAPGQEHLPSVEVPIIQLDDYNDQNPIMLKIDVEGFELAALRGAGKLLSNPALKVILVELNGLGKKYGFSDDEVAECLESSGFRPHQYDPFNRALKFLSSYVKGDNTLYVRDIEFVTQRLADANPYSIGNFRL